MKNKQLTINSTNAIKDLLIVARTQVVQHINTTMEYTYFEIGKGFSVTNLERMRLFYVHYSKSATVLPIS